MAKVSPFKFIPAVRAEAQKVTWPTRRETMITTIMVFIMVGVAGIFFALAAACPQGIDVYFENVGGAVQRAVFPLLNDFGRMIMCGMIAEYNDAEPQPGPSLVAAVRKRLRIQGFIVSDHAALRPDNLAKAAPLVRSGALKYREDIVEGIDNAPAAFIGLLHGRNFGKLIVRVSGD